MKDRRILITCLVLLLVGCLILSCASLIGTGIYLVTSKAYSISEEIPNPQSEQRSQPQVSAEPTKTPSVLKEPTPKAISPQTEIDPTIAHQMDEIQMQVILERGLKPSEDVNRLLYTPEQLREKIQGDFEDEYSPEEARIDAITMASFGLLKPDFDLYHFQIDLLSEQIAGFYDQKTGEMAIIQGENFGGTERFTYAHEYVHALQDQNYDIENGLNFNDEACDADAERCAAIRAFIEGDATLAQFNWFISNATPEDQADIIASLDETDMAVFESAPEFISMDLLFPYEYGYAFAQHLYNNGGWGTVDRAYQNLPTSTEQILHPERYPDDQPVEVKLPELDNILTNEWEKIDQGVMGEWFTYLILAKGLDEDARIKENNARTATEGWGGDSYIVYYNEMTAETVMILHAIWDSSADADEFADIFREYANERFGKSSNDAWQDADGHHHFNHQADTTTWILAPDAETASAIWQLIQSSP